MVELCKGEIEQIRDKYNFDQSLRTYLRRIKKENSFAHRRELRTWSNFIGGRPLILSSVCFGLVIFVGMSYQIIDDILDFVSTEEKLGKPAGGRSLTGKYYTPGIICDGNSFSP
ncbi:hypothetical protein GCM10020331_067770 [Ectobacillus funiculus]